MLALLTRYTIAVVLSVNSSSLYEEFADSVRAILSDDNLSSTQVFCGRVGFLGEILVDILTTLLLLMNKDQILTFHSEFVRFITNICEQASIRDIQVHCESISRDINRFKATFLFLFLCQVVFSVDKLVTTSHVNLDAIHTIILAITFTAGIGVGTLRNLAYLWFLTIFLVLRALVEQIFRQLRNACNNSDKVKLDDNIQQHLMRVYELERLLNLMDKCLGKVFLVFMAYLVLSLGLGTFVFISSVLLLQNNAEYTVDCVVHFALLYSFLNAAHGISQGVTYYLLKSKENSWKMRINTSSCDFVISTQGYCLLP